MAAAGKDIADFVGFKVIDSRHVQVPNAEEITGAIDKLNKLLPDDKKITLRFYSTPPEKPQIAPTPYLVRFANEGMLPMASAGTTMIHDLSFHSSSIFYPKDVIGHARHQASTILGFSEFVMARLKNEPGVDQTTLKKVILNIKTRAVTSIDVGTGNLAPGLTSRDFGSIADVVGTS